MKIKVMHLIGNLKMGGAETLVTNYAHKIDKSKFDFFIVTISGKNNTINEKRLEQNGVRVIHLGDKLVFPQSTRSIFKRFINKIHRFILVYKCINKERPDIIHAHLNVTKYLVPINIKKMNIRLFYTFHSELSSLFGKGKFINRFATTYCIKNKGMVPIALHKKMKQEADNIFNINNTIILPNGIDMERFNKKRYDKNRILKSLNIKNDSFIIGHVGRFSKVKNHHFIIKVFKAIKDKKDNAHLILIGTGELEDLIRKEVERLGLTDSVSFLGNRADIPELMSIMHVFIFPSLYEGLPIALIEAQAMGLKCVVSDRIPSEAFLTDRIISLSLESPIEDWCKYILENNYNQSNDYVNLKKYDMNMIIKKLEKLYLTSVALH